MIALVVFNQRTFHPLPDDQSVKFWLGPVALARNLGFGAVEPGRIPALIKEKEAFLLEKWNERFGS